LYESRAISRYVALKYAAQGSPLIPADPADLEAIAKFEEAASIEYANFERFVSPILNERVFKKSV
jgi:glutathione S-transferase